MHTVRLLSHGLLAIYDDLLAGLADENQPSSTLAHTTVQLEKISDAIVAERSKGVLDPKMVEFAACISHNINIIGTAVRNSECQAEQDIVRLSSKLDHLLNLESSRAGTERACGGKMTYAVKRARQELTPVSPLRQAAQVPTEDLDPVRTWLLANLHYPFPTPSEKTHLAKLSSRPRANIETDLTNYRRRSGWTDFKNKYCSGDTSKARDIIWEWMCGNEVGEDMKADLEGMKGYVERREATKVGGWIETLAEKAREMLEGKGASITEIEEEDEGDEEEVESAAVSTIDNPFPTPPLSAKTSADSLSATSSYIPKSNKRNVSDSSSVSAVSAQAGMAFNFQPLHTPNKRNKSFQGGMGVMGKGKKRVGNFDDEGREQKMRFEGPDSGMRKEGSTWSPLNEKGDIHATTIQYTPPVIVTPPRSNVSPPSEPILLSTPPTYVNNTYTPPYHAHSSPYPLQESPYHPSYSQEYHHTHLAPPHELYTFHPDPNHSSPYGLTPYPAAMYYPSQEHHHHQQQQRYSPAPAYPVYPHPQPPNYPPHPEVWSTNRPIPQYLSHIQPVSHLRSTPSQQVEGGWIGGDHKFVYQAERTGVRGYRQ